MTQKVFALDTKPGIQRDGTVFDMDFYTDGRWVRFQRGRPRKMLGYRLISNGLQGPSRGIWMNPNDGINRIFSGYDAGLQELTIDNNGIGAGVTDFTLSNFTSSANNLWQFDGYYNATGGVGTIVAHPGQNLTNIDSTADTPVLSGSITGTTMSQVGVFTQSVTLNGTTTMSISPTTTLIGAGQSVTGTGIPANTTVTATVLSAPNLDAVTVTGVGGQVSCTSTAGLFVGQTVRTSGVLTGSATGIATATTYYIIATDYSTTFTLSATSGGAAIVTTAGTTTGLVFTLGQFQAVTLSNSATSAGTSTITFNNNVSVSGGCVSLHPYLFVYGNNGLIRNNSANDLDDWVSADANETNVATTKIVQGLPVRGGSNAPSGLFWSLDSLIRVSFIGGVGTPPQYWRYDIITAQSSILSSQSAIEYGGVYYWCGVDCFLMYNGVVKEIPNNFNMNYFFDNLNYAQRQKVWVAKVPRWGEIWWYYPRGNSEECNDAIVYNTREQCWYDAGTALGARRSAGFYSQVFHYPITASWEESVPVQMTTELLTTVSGSNLINTNTTDPLIYVGLVVAGLNIASGTTVTAITASGLNTLGSLVGGTLYTAGTYTNVPLTTVSGTGFSALATVVVSAGSVTSVTVTSSGYNYVVGATLSAAAASIGGTGSGFLVTVTAIWVQTLQLSLPAIGSGAEVLTFSTPAGYIGVWQHEIGVDAVEGQNLTAIESYFETNDLGLVSGGPSQPSLVGENVWLRVERVEPDFVQAGEMECYITGRPFAQDQDTTSTPYVFGPNTGKIDMREQRRELRVKFRSNVQGGDYQLGKVLLNADIGDVRP